MPTTSKNPLDDLSPAAQQRRRKTLARMEKAGAFLLAPGLVKAPKKKRRRRKKTTKESHAARASSPRGAFATLRIATLRRAPIDAPRRSVASRVARADRGRRAAIARRRARARRARASTRARDGFDSPRRTRVAAARPDRATRLHILVFVLSIFLSI